jgi:diaminopimelate decarboxylase
MIRVNPGEEAHTHEFLQTGVHDSKFGISIVDNSAIRAMGDLVHSEFWSGFHGGRQSTMVTAQSVTSSSRRS